MIMCLLYFAKLPFPSRWFFHFFSFLGFVLGPFITHLVILGCLLMFKGEGGGGELIGSSEYMGEASCKEMGVASI